ncbi:hypothetical protein HU200_005450 [Digitaria exilis]|uniref:Uncharacterized protein n=1 Tax=Digitaria exilis TaxID=1010633 RepID=A0A835KWH6_9POAL|nr:hypothetical protein HU200_005450 [Digitaria exilis]
MIMCPFTRPFYIHFGKLLRQKEACQSSFQVTLLGQFARGIETGLAKIYHYDSDLRWRQHLLEHTALLSKRQTNC